MLLAVGGTEEDSIRFSEMVVDPKKCKVFIDSCVDLLKKYNFDGLDLDWARPTLTDDRDEDKENLDFLLHELRTTFGNQLLLTMAVSAEKDVIDKAYNATVISEVVDLINLKAYDYNGPWNTRTGYTSPLWASRDRHDLKNVNFSVSHWLNQGVPPEKLILGVTTLARTFTLSDVNQTGVGAPAIGPGKEGPYTRQPGIMSALEVCEELETRSNWSQNYDSYQQGVYSFLEFQWMSYDTEQTIRLKGKLVQDMQLGGAMLFSLDLDDFNRECYGYSMLDILSLTLNVNFTDLDDTTTPGFNASWSSTIEDNSTIGTLTTSNDDNSTIETTNISDDNSTIATSSTSEDNSTIGTTTTSDDNSTIVTLNTSDANNTIATPSTYEDNSTIGTATTSDDNSTIVTPSTSDDNSTIATPSTPEENSTIVTSSTSDENSTIATPSTSDANSTMVTPSTSDDKSTMVTPSTSDDKSTMVTPSTSDDTSTIETPSTSEDNSTIVTSTSDDFTTTVASSTRGEETTSKGSTMQPPVFECTSEGPFPHPTDCSKYYICYKSHAQSGFTAEELTCEKDKLFHKILKVCFTKEKVKCE